MTTKTELRDEVRSALQHALENGYEDVALEWSPEDTAYDMIAYDDDLADAEPTDLIPLIEEWRREQSGKH